MPALYLAQQDCGGWLPEAAFDEVAAVMGLPATRVAQEILKTKDEESRT